MKKIALFVDAFYPFVDGVVEVVNNYAKRIGDEEFDVMVFAPKPRDKKWTGTFPYKVARCKSVKVPFLDYDLSLPGLDRKFKKAIKAFNPDLVHIHSPFAVGAMGAKYAKKHNIPLIGTMHSQFKRDFMRATHSKLLTKLLLHHIMRTYNKCDEFYGVNSAISQIFYEYGAKHMPKVQRNGTDMIAIKDEKTAIQMVNKKFNLPADMPVFLFVGRINRLKNIYFTLEALEKLQSKYFKMIFVGEGQDMEDFKKKVASSSVADNVIFTGKILDRQLLSAIYLRAKLFLFPSVYDASSLVQIEAASQHTPTVFLQGTATSATVTNDVNGFITEPTTDAFAKKVDEILQDEKYYKKVSDGAFRDLYVTWDEIVDSQKQIYEQFVIDKIAGGGRKYVNYIFIPLSARLAA